MKNRDKILNVISKKTCGISAKGISNIFLDSIDKTTIYRNLDKLLEDGDIIEDFSKSGEKKYSIKENHHHHFVCNICKREVNIGCFVEKELRILEEQLGFIVKNHSFVLNGICNKCR